MILVTGATGFVGRALVERLATNGYPVRILMPKKHARKLPWSDKVISALETIPGSIDDSESLHQAMLGVHTVFHLASAQWWGHRSQLEQIDLRGTRNVITAARSARIGRLMLLSHLGAAPSSAYLLLRIKGQVEELIKASGIAHTIFRCGIVFGPEDSFVNGIALMLRANPLLILQPGQGETLLHPLYINDLMAALIYSLEALHTIDQTVEIGGPEYISYNEMLRTIMRVTSAQRMIVSVPPYMLRTLVSVMSRIFPRWPMTPQWLDLLAANRIAPLRNLYDQFEVRGVRFEDTIIPYMRGRNYFLELLRTTLKQSRTN